MIKRFAYILFILIFTQRISAKSMHYASTGMGKVADIHLKLSMLTVTDVLDTTKTKAAKKQEAEDKKKIKEIAKAKRQIKPEKLGEFPTDSLLDKPKIKPKRQRRPEGLVRPPEMPRRNN